MPCTQCIWRYRGVQLRAAFPFSLVVVSNHHTKISVNTCTQLAVTTTARSHYSTDLRKTQNEVLGWLGTSTCVGHMSIKVLNKAMSYCWSSVFTAHPQCSQCGPAVLARGFCPSVRLSVLPSYSGIWSTDGTLSRQMKIRLCGFQRHVRQSY